MVDKNNFDAIRIILALIVVFVHLATLTQLQEFKIFATILDSDFVIKGFFAISGFLVMKSFLSSASNYDFAKKRIRRIYPAYFAAIILCLIIGAIATRLSLIDFFQSIQTVKYFIANALFLNFLQPSLPATFETNPMQAMNGALWTIKIEVCLYVCIPIIFWLFKKFGNVRIALLIVAVSVSWVYFFTYYYGGHQGIEIARQFPGQLSYFVLGGLCAVNKTMQKNLHWIALIAFVAFMLSKHTAGRIIIEPIFYASIIIYLSTSAVRNINFGKYGDVAYGIYLYHFPIIQYFIHLGIYRINPWLGLITTLLMTILMALLSWHLIEKRFLKRTSHYIVATEVKKQMVSEFCLKPSEQAHKVDHQF